MWLNSSMFCLLSFLCFVDFFCETNGLKSNDTGVCVVKKSVRKTRSKVVWVSTNKWCGRKKCVVKRTRPESYTVTSNQAVCCNGWQYQSDEDVCSPLCSTGCSGGRCISPETCQCDPPSILDPQHKNSCSSPICDHPCINGDCGWNNTCICKGDFVQINATHCVQKCAPGYIFDGTLTCVPKCDKNCTNGRCTGPNICTCLVGYRSIDNFTCAPVCDACVNSDCAGPNLCSCHEGFKKVNETHCVPNCDSCNGDCVGPNVCKCREGFDKIGEVCQPKCERACKNGSCSAPNVCTCNKGFKKKTRNCKCLCSGTCNERGECLNGTCKAAKPIKETVCTSRDFKGRCLKIKAIIIQKPEPECCEGWEYNDDEDTCVAECLNGCEGGQCVAPNKCECDPPLVLKNGNICTCGEGYEKKTDKCEPICHVCDYGVCIAPNQCKCFDGYSNSAGKCSPICKSSCFNSECSSPNKCTCLSDHQRVNATHCKPKCGPGFVNNPYTLECEPHCDPSCEHGYCFAPNVCKCYEGYEKNGSKCEPVCSNCNNGVCVAPNKCECSPPLILKNGKGCTCDDGYEFKKNKCQPVCNDCEHGVCIAPNKCKCFEGYANISGKCSPICIGSCFNGECLSPNKCTCFSGYQIANATHCKLRCDPGFTNNPLTLECEPHCDPPCKNGLCIDPNVCKCDDGYEKSRFKCEPACRNCKNGDCIAPNKCRCYEGYSIAFGVCHPVCKKPCVNGHCSSPNVCTCEEGYIRNETDTFACNKPCKSSCNGRCADGDCICNPGYMLENDTCVYRLVECSICGGNCTENACSCADGNPCFSAGVESSEVASAKGLASIELSWLLGGAIGLLLLILLAVTIQRTWKKRKQYESKTARDENACGSVVYTIPGTLLNRNVPYDDECQEEYDFEKEVLAREVSAKLLTTEDDLVHDSNLNV